MSVKGRVLSAFAAAKYLGYEPQSSSSRDPQMRAFYEMARVKGIAHRKLGRLNRYREADLDAALASPAVAPQPLDQSLSEMQQLAAKHALGQPLHMRLRRQSPHLRAVAGGVR